MVIDDALNQSIETFIRENEPEMIKDVIDLISIPSIRADETPEQPFGSQCARAMDRMLTLAKGMGFETENHGYYYGTCILPGGGGGALGMAAHMDVVPADPADGWKRPPFEGYVENGYIVGRGSTDNKGPGVAALYIMKYFRERGVRLKHSLQLLVGSDEESGMADMERYNSSAAPKPAFTLVPDAPWPVCYAEKGRITFNASAGITGGNLAEFTAGEASNSIPASARALVSGVTPQAAQEALARFPVQVEALGDLVLVSAAGISKHASTPEGAVDAAHLLARALCDSGLLQGAARTAAAALAGFTGDHYGQGFGASYSDEKLGRLTHACSVVRTGGGRLSFTCDLRYPATAPSDKLCASIREALSAAGFRLDGFDDDPPNYIPPETPLVAALTDIANRQMGTAFPPSMMGGGTYARKLQNAAGYGPSRPDVAKPFPAGHGWAHQVDEAVRIQNLTDQIRVYIPALLYLDETL